MSGEGGTAFYKGVKFWFTLLLAALLAALLWRLWDSEDEDGGRSASRRCQRVSNMR